MGKLDTPGGAATSGAGGLGLMWTSDSVPVLALCPRFVSSLPAGADKPMSPKEHLGSPFKCSRTLESDR